MKPSDGRRSCVATSVARLGLGRFETWGGPFRFFRRLLHNIFSTRRKNFNSTADTCTFVDTAWPWRETFLPVRAAQREFACARRSIWLIRTFHISISSWNWCFSGDCVVSTKARLDSIWPTRARILLISSRMACASLARVFASCRSCAFSAALAAPACEPTAWEVEFGVCCTAPSSVTDNKAMKTGLYDIAPPKTVLSIWYLALRSQLYRDPEVASQIEIPSTKYQLPSSRDCVLHYDSALHHKANGLQRTHVLQGIVGHGNHVRILAGFQRAHVFGASDEIGGAASGGADGLGRRHFVLHHVEELLRVIAMRIHAGIGAKRHLGAAFYRALKVLALQASDRAFLVDIFLGQPELDGLAEDVIVVINVHHQVDAVLFGQTDAFVINQAGVFDGINAGKDCIFDSLRTVRVRRDLAAGHMRLVGSGFQLFRSKLRSARTIALGEDTTRGKNLDYVNAVFHLGTHYVANLVNAIGDLEVALFRKHGDACLRRKVIQVAVPAGNRDARPAGYDTRSGNQAFIDGVAQINGQKWKRAHIAHAGKAGFQRLARVYDSGKRALKRRVLEVIDFVVTVSARAQMRVAIDQAGKHRGVRKVNHGGACWDCDRTGGRHSLNAFTHHHNHHVLARLVSGAIKQMSGANVSRFGRGRGRRRLGGLRQCRQNRDHRYDEE